MKTDWHDLIQRYIAGMLNQEETMGLQEALKADASLRTLFLDYMNLDAALEVEATTRYATCELLTAPMKGRPARWFSWRPLAAAAAGLVFGMLCTSVIFAHVAGGALQKERRLFPLQDTDFEQGIGKLPGNPPASLGIWTGDGAEIVGASSEAHPPSGRKMLRFVRAETDPLSPQGVPNRCDVYQLIDLGPIWAQAGQDDEVTLEVRVLFLDANTGPEGSGTFRCRLLVHPGVPEEIRNGWPQSRYGGCAYARTDLPNGPATRGQWRTAQAKVILPRDARIAAVHLGMIRFTETALPPAEFGQCYVDEVSLTVTARPLPRKE